MSHAVWHTTFPSISYTERGSNPYASPYSINWSPHPKNLKTRNSLKHPITRESCYTVSTPWKWDSQTEYQGIHSCVKLESSWMKKLVFYKYIQKYNKCDQLHAPARCHPNLLLGHIILTVSSSLRISYTIITWWHDHYPKCYLLVINVTFSALFSNNHPRVY